MTELRDELKVRPGEGAVDYTERVEAVLEKHRLETLKAESNRLAREGGSAGPEGARMERALGQAVAALEAVLEDPQKAKRVQGFKEAAEESRRVARAAKTRLSEADGTGAAARERQRTITARNF